MAKIISIISKKGGNGKTSTTIGLSHTMSAEGKKVLIIALDTQGNIDSFFDIKQTSIDDFEMGFIQKTNDTFIDMLPSSKLFNRLEKELLEDSLTCNYYIKEKLLPLLSITDYDYIIFDNPPSLNLLGINTLMCADVALIPCKCDLFSFEGLQEQLNIIDNVKNQNTKLESKVALVGYQSNFKSTTDIEKKLENNKAYTGLTIANRQHITNMINEKKSFIDNEDLKRDFKKIYEVVK